MSRLLQLCQITCTYVHGRFLGTWVKLPKLFLFMPVFEELMHLRVRPVDGFSRMMAQTTRACANMCLLGFVYMAPHLGAKPLKTFWGVNRRFQAKLTKSNNVHIIKTTVSIPTKFCTVIKTTKCPSWVVPTNASKIQDVGRPPSWKNRKITIYQPRFERFRQNSAW